MEVRLQDKTAQSAEEQDDAMARDVPQFSNWQAIAIGNATRGFFRCHRKILYAEYVKFVVYDGDGVGGGGS